MDIGLLILRLVVGLTMAAHGSQKLFGWFGGHGLAGTGGFFEGLGFRPGRVHALVAGLCEFGGGLLLVLGFLTPLGSALVITVMVAAIGSVHVHKGFFNSDGGYELPLLIIATVLALAFIGPGAYAVDSTWSGDWRAGLAALAAGLIAGGAALMTRRQAPAATHP